MIDLSVESLRYDRFFGLVVSLSLALRRLIADGSISNHDSILLEGMRFVKFDSCVILKQLSILGELR